MSNSTKIIFLIGILLLIYGYLCRLLSVYFFWDSKHFGWILMVTGLMGFLIDLRKARIAQKKNIFWVRTGVAIIVVAFAIGASASVMLKSSDVYEEAIELIRTSGEIKNEIGEIRGFGLIPSGLDTQSLLNAATSGTVTFVVTVRGNRRYKDVEIFIERTPQTPWVVTSARIIYN